MGDDWMPFILIEEVCGRCPACRTTRNLVTYHLSGKRLCIILLSLENAFYKTLMQDVPSSKNLSYHSITGDFETALSYHEPNKLFRVNL
ncbi:hypothetical protein RclHR1_11420002 [Rhizophagus clarus]|uniref:Uncharacterized protein n=1 Tax=Rhizophagus clarus TaxID=94130 RepID=A0A2Z6Q4E1_9GLOM|nr:hypothetical protein RclHR1_11420002 [Rhizophagus clarus]